MRNKLILLVAMVMIFSLSGCVDLFGMPGVAVSPDGSTVYFLGGGMDIMTGETSDTMPLMSVGADGTAQIVMEQDQTLISGFDVNPSNGDVAFVMTTEADGTSIMVYNPASGPRELVATASLPKVAVGTMLKYSPDGSQIAVSMLTLPIELSLDSVESEDLTPEQMALIDSVLYLVDANAGTVKTISSADTEWVNMVDWNPSGTLLAYNAWVDTNADGTISTSGGFDTMMSGTTTASDLSQIRVYDVAAGSTTNIDSTALEYAPTFVSDTAVAYVSFDAMMMMMGGAGGVKIYDLGTGSSTDAYSAAGLISGLALSPDGTQVAWTESGSSTMSMESESSSAPNNLMVADTSFSAPRQVAQVPGETGFLDAPVWSPDGSGIYLTSTGIFSALIGSFASMGNMMGDLTGTPVAPEASIPQQQITLVNVADGSTQTVYTGSMSNSGLMASVLSLATSSGMEDMMGGLEGQ